MQPLKTQFRCNGFDYQQCERSPLAAIYRQSDDSSNRLSYEVVKIRVAPAANVFGEDLPEREVYPPSSAWGTSGWTYSGENALAHARRKFESLSIIPHPSQPT